MGAGTERSFIICSPIRPAVWNLWYPAVWSGRTGRRVPASGGPSQITTGETASRVRIACTYETVTVPPAQTEVFYEIDGRGVIQIRAHYHGMQGLPELPLFGMRFVMPTCADGFTYEGMSGETYPDRKAGGIPGIYKVKGLPVTPCLVPQDCGMHMDTSWVEIQRSRRLDNRKSVSGSAALRFQSEKGRPFAFSCLPYTASELEHVLHQDELRF